ncbi:MAG: hypothetical protein LBR10_02435 [Prevotellaceae bacterium]|jgi:hypothetical protein|nr:hypothetical protein [Prevotellaceae bacterium]
MYQTYSDIFTKASLYVNLATEFKEDVEEVNIHNAIENYFGRDYCRVYVIIKLKETSTRHYEFQEAFWNKFRYENKYFSFYLPDYPEKDYEHLRNREEEIHYDYIWNFIEWALKNTGIKVNADRFKSQYDLQQEDEEWLKKLDEEKTKLKNAMKKVKVKVGQIVAVKQYKDSSLRIGKIKRMDNFIELTELKKDLTPSKRTIDFLHLTDIYAILDIGKLSVEINKTNLLDFIEKEQSFEGLIWRRPQEFWK